MHRNSTAIDSDLNRQNFVAVVVQEVRVLWATVQCKRRFFELGEGGGAGINGIDL